MNERPNIFTEMLTVRQLQAQLKIGRNKTYELIRSGEIPSKRIGRQIRIRQADIIDYLNPQNNI